MNHTINFTAYQCLFLLSMVLIKIRLYSTGKMCSYSQIKLDIYNKLAVITLDQPRKKNAINSKMYSEITNALEMLSNKDDTTITAITGSGEYYCSGTDLSDSMSALSDSIDKAVKETSVRLRRFIEAFINHNKILVAVVNGPAIGIAVTTLALCDIAYCSDSTTFQTPFTKLGMTAEGCSSYTFPKIMGPSKANEMLLFNCKITAKEAYDFGLIAKVYAKEQIDSVLWPKLKRNANELPFKSLVYSKQMLRKFDIEKLHEANRLECQRLEERWKSEDCLNAIMNFFNKRSKMNNQNWPERPEILTLDFGPFERVHAWKRVSLWNKYSSAARSKHTIVAYNDVIYIFGGDRGNIMLNDLLKFDVKEKSWHLAHSFDAPTPRYHHSAVVHENSMFIFGGYTGDIHSNSNLTNKNDLYEYKFQTGQWVEWNVVGVAPVARSAHGAVVYDGKMWIFAGYDGNARLNDMWTISLIGNGPKMWTKITQAGDCPPTCCNFPVAVAHDSMFVFSGQSGAKITNSLFQFHFKNFTWKRISTEHILRRTPSPPARRFGHTMVAYDRHLYVFGGAADGIMPNDLHCYDLDTQTWSIITPSPDGQIPSGRLFHAATLIGDAMYIFGGTVDNNVRTGEMYRFQFASYPKCTLHDDFGKLLENKEFCDVEFLLGPDEHKIEAHLALVTARSKYLAEEIRMQNIKKNQLSEVEKDVNLIQVRLPEAVPKAFEMVLNYIYTDQIDPTKMVENPDCNKIVLLIIDVYRLACKFHMKRLEQLCIQYLENTISHQNVLSALHYSSSLKLHFIKEYCLKFIVKESNFTLIVMSDEFENVEKRLMVDIIRRRQGPKVFQGVERHFDDCGTSLEEDLEAYLKKDGKEFCDIILKLENTQIPAHKAILAARCTYFQALFRSFMPTNKTVNIQIGDIVPSKQSFDSLLRYIYYGEINMSPEDSLYLFSAPYFYGFTNNRLNAFCKQNLEMNVSIDHVLPILEAADSMSASDMKKYALRLIVQNFSKVARLAKMKTLTRELLLDILEALAVEMSDSKIC